MTRRDVLLVGLFWVVSAGCTRRDWVSDMLVLADITGTWVGTIELTTLRGFRLTLRQNGAKVTGDTAAAPASPLVGPVQGVGVETYLLSPSRQEPKGRCRSTGTK